MVNHPINLPEMQDRALQIASLYDELNVKLRGNSWTRADTMMGFVGDVGDLARLVMAADGVRDMPNHREALGHEFARCMDLLEADIKRQL